MRRRLVLPLVLIGLLAAALLAAPAGAAVPQGWVGTSVSPGDTAKPERSTREWNRMVTAGVQAARVGIVWGRLQPYASVTSTDFLTSGRTDFKLGVGNVPTFFAETDAVVRLAATRGIRLQPVVLDAPAWAAAPNAPGTMAIPKDNNTYGNFLRTLIRRYGPNGTFWSDNPDVPKRPVQAWQVWNEPNIPHFWGGEARRWRDPYVRMLKVAHDAIKQEDGRAKVVLAGLSSYRFARAWTSLDQIYNNHIYNRATMRGLFDVSAVHPYTLLPKNVIRYSHYIRDVMNKNGDRRKQQMITELSWPSSRAPNGRNRARSNGGFEVTERGQASMIREGYPMLARYRGSLRIAAVYWYTWITSDKGNVNAFDYAGLRSYGDPDSRAKPAYSAWANVVRKLEGCRNYTRSKRSVTQCG